MNKSLPLLIGALLGLSCAVQAAWATTPVSNAAAGTTLGAQTLEGEVLGEEEWVLKVWTEDASQLQWLNDHFDVWRKDLRTGAWRVRLRGTDIPRLDQLQLRYEVDRQFTDELRQPLPAEQLGAGTIDGFPCYRRVGQTLADAQALRDQFPELVELRDIGDSWQKQNGTGGEDIVAMVLSSNQPLVGQPTTPKPIYTIIAAIHAREYATAELAMRFAEELVQGYGTDPEATWLLDHNEIHVIPQLNPDGRGIAEISATRSKRKNDDSNFCDGGDITSRGVDLNRNSSVLWGGVGSSANSCSDVFRGNSPASEPETSAIENYLDSIYPDLRPGDANNLSTPAPVDAPGLFISIHSFSELVLFPWEGNATNSGNHNAMRTLSRKLAFFNDYAACQDCLGQTAGTTVDYAYGELGVAALTFEIGTSFFQSCSSFNNTVLPDNLAALRFAAKSARRPYLSPGAPEVVAPQLSANMVEGGETVTLMAQINDSRRRLVSDDGGEAADSAQPISAAFYSIDTPAWAGGSLIPMQAMDGQFNAATEAVQATLDTSGLDAGRHLLFVYGEDSSGLGVPSAVFLEVLSNDRIFSNGFEAVP